jgi:hypothetical protein
LRFTLSHVALSSLSLFHSIMHWLSFNNRCFTFHGTGEAQWAGCVPAHAAVDARAS